MGEETEKKELRRQEAASFLDMGLRTLDRYRAEGRITPVLRRQKNGKTSAFYAEADLAELKEELKREASAQEFRRRQKRELAERRSARQVRFRLAPTHHEALLQEAKAQERQPNDYARALVREGLESEMRLKVDAIESQTGRQDKRIKVLSAELAETRSELHETKNQVALLLTFLTTKAMAVSEEKAKAWIEKHLFGEKEQGEK